ncbi:MAG: hypothetical protein KIT81_00545 [Alphaproteobacteria bacterium]|nr:hypothetical protein [Alphaproteobacteria bacterium]
MDLDTFRHLPAHRKKTLIENAKRTLCRQPDNALARHILAIAKDCDLLSHRNRAVKNRNKITWTPHGHDTVSYGLVDNKRLAIIRKFENHNSRNNEVYEVEVAGRVLPDRYRYLRDAHKAAEDALANTLAHSKSVAQN